MRTRVRKEKFMKKKLLLLIATVAILTCLFAIAVNAAEPNYEGETVTLSDGTVCPLWDTDGNALIWYVSATSADKVNTYAYVSASDSSVDYYNSWNGGNQLNSITITDENGATYDTSTIVVANIRYAKITSGNCIGNSVNRFSKTFSGSTNIQYVYVPAATIVFGGEDFKNCSNLKYINIEELTELTSIGSQTFNGCSKLFEGKSIDLTNTKISVISAGGFAAVAATEIELPSTLKEVQNYAFRGCKYAKRIVFNSTLAKINTSELFSSCSELESIEGFGATIESGLIKSIGHNMFKDNYKLKNVDGMMENGILIIPEGITSINANCAFTNCDQIIYVEFPSTINYVGQAAFSYCDSLKLVSFDKVNAKIVNAIANGESYTKVTFNNCGIFKGCKSLVALSVPEGTTEIVNRFVAESCTSLTAVYLPNSVTSFGTNGNGQGPFDDATNMYFVQESFTVSQCLVNGEVDLTKLELPEKPTVYYMPTSLKTFTGHVETNQYSRGGTMFRNCASMNDVIVFGENFQNFIAYNAFQNAGSASAPKTVVFTGDITRYVTTQNAKNINFVFANENDKTPADIGITHVYKNNNNADSYMYFAVKDETTDTVTTYKYAYSTANSEITDTNAIGAYVATVESNKVEEHVIDYKNSVISKAPTCSEKGLLIAICLCGESMGNIELDALGHTYVKIITAPTCLDDGYTTYYCSTCGDTYKDDYVDALGHTEGEAVIENVVEGNCTTNGSYDTVVYCTVCKDEVSRTTTTTEAKGHSYNSVVTEPDCLNGGYTTYTCSVCGDTYVDSQVDALGHSYNSVVTEPDCTNGGYTTHTCSVCGDTYVDSQVDALGHSYNSVVTAPTCETEGYTTHTCSVCGDSYVDGQVDALGHNLGDWTFNAETAELVKSCQNGCGKTETKAVEAKADGEYYETLADAILAGGEVVLLKNVEINSMIVVAKDSVVTLDLNGKTITGKDTTSKNFSILDNRGTLTIKDEVGGGKFTLVAEINSGWNRYSAVIANNPGGKLTVNGGTIEHLGGTDMAYGIDNLTNGKGTYAETIINGGVVKSTYRAIRQFLNGIEAQNILTINGGTIEGANKSIFFHDPSKNANSGTLTISENATINGDIYLFVTAGSTEWPVEVSIEAEATVLTANIPNGYAVLESEGKITSHKHSMSGWTLTTAPVYGKAGEETNKCANCDYAETRAYNAAAKIGDVYYATFAEAYAAVKAGETITLLAPITVTSDMTLNIEGITIESAGDAFVVTGGTLIVEGNGVVKAGTAGVGSWCAVWANGGTVVINGGTYSVGGDNSTDDVNHQNDLIYTKNGGKVTINGGTFIAGEGIWALNENDANRGTITVKGGNFVGFNPANNVSEGEGTNFVADGYAVVANGTEFTVAQAAAKIGDVYYATFAEAYAAVKAGETIALLAPITVTSDMTLNIEGITIESAGDVFVVTSGTLIVEGNGVVNAGKAGVGSWCAVWANGGTVVINGGTYSVGGDNSTDDVNHQNDLIYTKNGGKVTINGGTFIAGEGIWALNENDANRGTITVKGGNFVGFNPANNVSEGEGTNFVADGYHAQKSDNVYTVAPHSFVLNDIVYKNGFENAGVKINTCTGCGATYEEATEAIFKNLGLSASEFEVGGITIGYKVNTEFLEEYEAVTGNEITYGVFAVLADKIGNGDILDEKGTPAAGVINKEIKSYGINEFNFKLVGFTTEKLMSAKIVMGAYVFERTQEGVNVSYIQPNVPQEGERYYAVSYNGLTGKED